ncbi:MAG TPA: ATP-binding protein [Duganella sp.]|uniref:PAS domain-containing hybrid sensor histidine kinase/response regulator n=1 Tax=Duganella sp. TaxID=1904440 RepID=UPI002ED1B602
MPHRPSPPHPAHDIAFAAGGGQMGELLRTLDWAATPLGPLAGWPPALRTTVSIMLGSSHPMYIAWGPGLHLLFNDAYRPILGALADPPENALGKPFHEVWSDVWHQVGPMLNGAMAGVCTHAEDQPFILHRHGYPEQMYATFSVGPVRDEAGAVAGVFCVCTETTRQKRVEERLRLLDTIGKATSIAADAKTIMAEATRLLGQHLDVTRVAYADLEPDNDRFTIRHDWTVEGAFSTVGVYSLDLFGSRATGNLRAGKTLQINNVDTELASGDGYEMFNQIGIKAIICCPLVKAGKLVAMMAVHQRHPRAWSADEVALVEDVVERCWAHIERVRSTEALREADRHKSEFLATLAHELRNPLAPVRNGLELMKLAGGNPVTLANVRAMMERQVSHMVHLINDLLDIARVSSGKLVLKKERAELKTLVALAVETSQPLLDAAGHKLTVRLQEADAVVDVDVVRLSQVLSNLLSNAAKYTPAGGHIAISATVADGQLVIEVADDGMGIATESIASVFDMFTQVGRSIANSKGGLGIGLSLVRRLLELHGGSVTAASPGIGLGSTFTIRLPLAAGGDTARLQAPAEVAQAPAPAARLRVLITDDNHDAADTLRDLLQNDGHETRVAYDGAGALAAAETFRPHVALLDIGMPGMDGYQTARAMRAMPGLENVTLAALTGWGAAEDRARSRAAGFDHHLLKPVVLAELRAMLRQLSA